MDSYNHIKDKLKGFINKYYSNILLKGSLLFLSLGALFFMFFLGVEYFLWLGKTGRMLLFIFMVLVETFLLYRYILKPIFYLLHLKRGIDDRYASKLIGDHFPEVSDKLINLLDLSENKEQSELLMASIQQRSSHLVGLNFSKAINFKEAIAKAKYLVVPILFMIFIWVTGNFTSFFTSYIRVVNYDLAYSQPAPFNFSILSKDLHVYKNKSFTIALGIEGKIKPEFVYVVTGNQKYLMQNQNGIFEYTINAATQSFEFYFEANGFNSIPYYLKVIEPPTILDFELTLDYPGYTSQPSEIIKSVGNATILEGTKVTWKVKAEHTDRVALKALDTVVNFNENANFFEHSKTIFSNFNYAITTSNSAVHDFENLAYSFKVIKDEAPKIMVQQTMDSLVSNESYFLGTVSDDYGMAYVQLVCYEMAEPGKKQIVHLLQPTNTLEKFYYTFPSGLDLDKDKAYSFYFEVMDNDAVNGGKIAKSEVFNSIILNDNQLNSSKLDVQKALISNVEKAIREIRNQSESLDNITDGQKEKSSLSFDDQRRITNFLQKQEFQENQMQKFSKQLKDNLGKTNQDDPLNKLLQERLERQELEAERNKKLLEELKDIADKINKEELTQKLESLAKNQKNGQRNLEQLVALTKRYYVTEMASQLAKDLKLLSKKQDSLSQKTLDSASASKQVRLNNGFDKLSQKLDELLKENLSLQKPLKFDLETTEFKSIATDQKDALEQLKQQKKPNNEDSSAEGVKKANDSKAANKQKSAAQKMDSLSEKLRASTSGTSSSSVTEDAEVLRQILDNLVIFTFKQEALISNLSKEEGVFSNQAHNILQQQELKNLFEHIDDSLFTLSLRVPEISEKINEKVTDIYYNIDRAVEDISESRLYQGVSYQKYVLTAGNALSDLLATILDNMQQSMQMGSGSGSGEDFQLPDIIKGQAKLNEQLGMSGKGKQSSSGKEGSSGEGGNEGQKGKGGNSGKSKEENTGGSSEDDGDGKARDGVNSATGSTGNGNSNLSEADLKELYNIYKQQEFLKNNLEKQLQDMINASDRKLGEKLLRQMSDFQDNLLENGITQQTIEKASIINYELLKLEGAALQQGKKLERESNTNIRNFNAPILSKPAIFDNKNSEVEILNRQVLPLQQNYQNKIKTYFKRND